MRRLVFRQLAVAVVALVAAAGCNDLLGIPNATQGVVDAAVIDQASPPPDMPPGTPDTPPAVDAAMPADMSMSMLDAMIDAPADARFDDAKVIDAPVIDAPVIDAPVIDASAVDVRLPDAMVALPPDTMIVPPDATIDVPIPDAPPDARILPPDARPDAMPPPPDAKPDAMPLPPDAKPDAVPLPPDAKPDAMPLPPDAKPDAMVLPPDAAVAPTIIKTTPANGDTGVDPTAVITIQFSELMDHSTINSSTVEVTRSNGVSVVGTYSFDDTTGATVASFHPAHPLALAGHYNVGPSTNMKSTAGLALTGASHWSFTVTDGAWQTPTMLQAVTTQTGQFPNVAMDANGDAVVAWQESNGTYNQPWANRYDSGIGWETAEQIDVNTSGNDDPPAVAMDPSGNAFALFAANDGSKYNELVSQQAPGQDWTTPAPIETTANAVSAGTSALATDPNGNVFAVWAQSNGTQTVIWASRYVPATGWGAPVAVDTDNSLVAFGPKVGTDKQGDARVVWQKGTAAGNYVGGANYSGGTWLTVGVGGGSDLLWPPQVAVDANGDAVAFWVECPAGSCTEVWNSSYNNGRDENYGGEGRVAQGAYYTQDTRGPTVASDAYGNFFMVWAEGTASNGNVDVLVDHDDNTFDPVLALTTNTTSPVFEPQVAVDTVGNAIVVWYQTTGTSTDIWASRLVAQGSWSAPEKISTGSPAYIAHVAISDNGTATAVWMQGNGSQSRVWAARFDAP